MCFKSVIRRELAGYMRVECVGDICAVRTVLVVNVSRNRCFLAFRAGVTVEIMTKTLVCM
jgi:hypothetical protein